MLNAINFCGQNIRGLSPLRYTEIKSYTLSEFLLTVERWNTGLHGRIGHFSQALSDLCLFLPLSLSFSNTEETLGGSREGTLCLGISKLNMHCPVSKTSIFVTDNVIMVLLVCYSFPCPLCLQCCDSIVPRKLSCPLWGVNQCWGLSSMILL